MPSYVSFSRSKGTLLLGDDLRSCYKGESTFTGIRHGQGAYTFPNTFFRYEGEYVNGQKHGEILETLVCPFHAQFTRQTTWQRNGQRESVRPQSWLSHARPWFRNFPCAGHGKLFLGDGSSYSGQFQHDEIMGKGERTYADGSQYNGEFVLGEPHGIGTLVSSKGWSYTGCMVKGRSCGQGVKKWVCGDQYEGVFLAGRFHGQGKLTKSDGYSYSGEWVANKPCGPGEEVSGNGDQYTVRPEIAGAPCCKHAVDQRAQDIHRITVIFAQESRLVFSCMQTHFEQAQGLATPAGALQGGSLSWDWNPAT
jgi:hypothetical protein